MSDDYRVQLDIYNGPLDLLLYLIRREEVDIYDIPIARITDQYLAYVELLRQIDPSAAGEFLVLAATLMEIKSRMLLPQPPVESDQEMIDPRLELVRQLLEYKRFKDAADQLYAAAQEQSLRFPRQPSGLSRDDAGHLDLDALNLWDLVEAFREMMAKTGRLAPHEVVYDDTPVALHAADIVDRLQREGGALVFIRVFEGRTRSECIGLFLALLELVRQRRIRVEQEVPFGPIYLFLLDATPIEEPSPGESFFASTVSAIERGEGAGAPTAEELVEEGPPPESADLEDDLGEMPSVPELPPDWVDQGWPAAEEVPDGADDMTSHPTSRSPFDATDVPSDAQNRTTSSDARQTPFPSSPDEHPS